MYACIYSLFVTNLLFSESAKILSIAPILSKSHYSIHQTILHELASRGHEIITISFFKTDANLTNYQEIQLPNSNQNSFIDSLDIPEPDKFPDFWDTFFVVQKVENRMCSAVLRLDYIQKLIKLKSSSVNLIITEVYFTKCFNLLAHKLNIPVINVAPSSVSVGVNNFLGNWFNPSSISNPVSGYTMNMTFLERLINSVRYIVTYWYQFFMYDTNLQELAENVLDMEVPRDDVLIGRLALGFFNNHFSFMPQPLTPNAKDIAGIHIKEPKPLPTNILEFIETAPHGVIFFSFGSAIRTSSISAEKMQILLQVFSIIPQKVLWRVNELNLNNLPSNVKIGKWFPQRDILEHKNVVAFISHCGLFGTLEAIYTATPILAIPFFFDQTQNAKLLSEKEAAIYIDFGTMNNDNLLNSIREITSNKKYKKNMRNLSLIFKDRPVSPLDSAVYWTEYVIRYKGAGHLRSHGADMPLYQYLLLDVVVFVISISILILYFIKCFIRFIFSCLHRYARKIKDKLQ